MAEQGWIKLGRGITAHWIWDRPLYLKWWLDMVMMAGWGQRRQVISGRLVTIGRGQFVASLSYLSQRWEYRRETASGEGKMMCPSERTVLKFLRLLEEEGMIKREPRNGVLVTAIITICDYDKYSTISENSDSDSDRGAFGGALRASDSGVGGGPGGGIDREGEGDPGGDAGHGRGSGRGSESAQQKKNIKKVKKEKEEYNTHPPWARN